MVPAHPHPVITGLTSLGMLVSLCGCIEHRAAATPPLPADPAPAGEPATVTQMISGAKVIAEPRQPATEHSPLPIDLPVSVWRRTSDGTISRSELRVTTARPWWQRFPADIVSDLMPVDYEVFASGTAMLAPVTSVDRQRLFTEATHDGYARTDAPAEKPTP